MIFTRSEEEIKQIIGPWLQCAEKGLLYGFGNSKAVFLDSDWRQEMALPLAGLFDNNPELRHTLVRGLPILSPDQAGRISGKIIIYSAAYPEIRDQLIGLGLRDDVDFMPYNDFMPLYHYFKTGRVFLAGGVSQIVTTHCSLNCHYCVSSINYNRRRQSFPLAELKAALTTFFGQVDLIRHFGLVGGEPLMHPGLTELTEFLINEYGERIAEVGIYTNGVLPPPPGLLAALGRHRRGLFHISDYREAGIEGYERKFGELLAKLRSAGVDFEIQSGGWRRQIRHEDPLDEVDLAGHYHRCAMRARCVGLVEDAKLYYCPTTWFAEQSGLFRNVSEHYLDLNEAPAPLDLIRHYLGFCPADFPSFCRHCHGADPNFYFPVPKARQAGMDGPGTSKPGMGQIAAAMRSGRKLSSGNEI